MRSNKQKKILLVEDEESLARGLEFNLSAEGYRIIWVSDGREALKKIENDQFDLIILDIMLPYVDGLEVAEHTRQKDPRIPILILTARTGLQDRIRGLEVGADDYLTKPFHLEELILRIKGMLKRKEWYKESSESLPIYRFGKNEINFRKMTADNGKRLIQLTAHEAILLKYLIDRKGEVVSRPELLEKVWNVRSDMETRTVDNFIVRLRRYFESDPEKPVYFKSIRGVGYLFDNHTD